MSGRGCSSRVVAGVEHVLFLDGVGYLSGPTKEIEILANRPTACTGVASEGVIVEVIAGFIELIAQAIISVFEIDGVSVTFVVTRKSSEGIVRLREARGGFVVSRGIKAKE